MDTIRMPPHKVFCACSGFILERITAFYWLEISLYTISGWWNALLLVIPPAQSFLVQIPAGSITIFYSLTNLGIAQNSLLIFGKSIWIIYGSY
jgi:hypothetical protein